MQNLHSSYNLDSKLVLENLKTDISGLSEKDVELRQKEYGKNIFEENSKNGLIRTFFTQFLNPLIFILIFASFVTVYLGENMETIVIWAAILINVLLSTYQEYRAENTIENLKKFIKNKALVKRDGEIIEIEAEDLVVGDIVVLQYGARVPADIRLIEVTNLKTDEMILTGESLPVEKIEGVVTDSLITERRNYCFCGTLVTNGNGMGVVTHIGENTEIGKIAHTLANTKKVLTPVQSAVKNVSWYILIVAILIVSFVFILGIHRGENIFEMLVLASAVAVGAVPEALPIALTVILSVGILNISKKGGLIRKLSAAETLGSTTLILTDKTGTLTEGKLNLENILLLDKGFNFADMPVFDVGNLSDNHKNILIKARKNFSVVLRKNDEKQIEYSGNAFEVILSRIIDGQNIDPDFKINSAKIISPFNSTNKYSISSSDSLFVFLGAPDILINNSNLDSVHKTELLKNIDSLSNEGKRLIAIAQKSGGDSSSLSDLNLLGLFVFSDLLREGIKNDIDEIVKRGVAVKMITGDLPGTAKFIGEKVGINASDDEVLTGSQLENISDEDLLEILPKIKIFARVTPEDKLRIGKLYQKLGEIVAMTGDGVNDSPSLKAMDIGISLSSGSEVAKSAADMILLRDDFRTIVDTIALGHGIRKNIQKVFVYLMSNSLDEVFVITGSLIAGLALPLTALQIIWVNVLTGTLPAIAFAYDRNNILRTKNKKIFDFKIKFMALGIGTVSSLLLFVLYYLLTKNIIDISVAQSVFFLCFASYILIISYSFIDLDRYIWNYNIFSNWRLNLSVLIGLVLIFATVYTKIGQNVFGLVPTPFNYLWILFGWLAVNVWVIEFTKYFFINKHIK
ncbi:MAG: cation-transporting P-type ATPase [Candidatus Pacebacteria bacterium]|nr:cation-transporting P-type ATPase [Candidatus Paceibacterota bacterium]MBP9716007.1 cation-transporting P-type ATPase [Candidatus Paceibacterota bacterium]